MKASSSSSFFYKCVADVEKAVIESLEKQYTDVLSPLKEYSAFRKYVKKIAKGSVCPYVVSSEVWYFLSFHLNLFPFSLGTKISSLVPPFLGRYCLEFYEKDA